MKILFGNTELTDIQLDYYEKMMHYYSFEEGARLMYNIVEKRLGITNSLTIDLRKELNKVLKKMSIELDTLYKNGGDFTDLIQV